MVLFNDNEIREYHLVDFNDLHQQMLFRRYKYYPDEYNIDILFKGVMAINIVAEYKGFKVSITEKKEGQICRGIPAIHYIFEISDNTNIKSYIEAAAFGVFHNYYPPKKSSILDLTPENKLVYWSKNDVYKYLESKKR